MTDRLKYRVWDKERKCFFNDDEVAIYPNGQESFFNADYDFAETVVDQSTGLKDKNGKLIYEGDIFKAEVINSFDEDENLYKIIYGQVSWFDIEACFTFARYQPSDLFEIEIIGNIHTNADLLGEE